MSVLPPLLIFVAGSFVFFGVACLVAASMRAEFERYGLASFRVLVGVLQLAGSTGLLVGWFFYRPLGVAAALGLTTLMILGVGVRRRIRDPLLKQLPAGLYAALSAALVYLLWPC
ncbi:MAG: DoxX family protein [Planctomycetota bacterium]